MEKRIITPNDGGEYFFGYYDLQPYDLRGKIHLAHRVGFSDRLPAKNDIAEVGFIDTEKKEFSPLAQTKAWNFQQGAMLRWFERDKSILFNDFDGEKYISRVVGVGGKEIKRFPFPTASFCEISKLALSVNFSRIYDFRKGYGYFNIADPYASISAPARDGIFLCDLQTGRSDLIVSYGQMAKAFEEPPFTDEKLVVNHITFSPSGKKYVFLLRNFAKNDKKWGTVLAVGDLNGNIKKLTNFEVNSHYSWKDDKTIMIYSGLPKWGVYFINTRTGERKRLNDQLCDRDDIHCNYSPNRKYFIGDGYPDKNNRRSLYLYDFETKKSEELFSVYSIPVSDVDIRCDLHARWFDDGKKISYDTTENGVRQICEIYL